MLTTFDPAYKRAIDLTKGNLIATANASGSGQVVRSTAGVVLGENGTATFTLSVVTGTAAIGLVNALYTFTGGDLGFDDNSIGFYNDGYVLRNGVLLASADPFAQGDQAAVGLARSGGTAATFYGVPVDPDFPSQPTIDLSDWTGPIYGAAQLANAGDRWIADWDSWVVTVPRGRTARFVLGM